VFLFILESIGTSELILIGIIALIFLGPRKLPQIARTIGKTMADFRSTTNEFKSTWEREVNFEEEALALRTGELPVGTPAEVPGSTTSTRDVEAVVETNTLAMPEIKPAEPRPFAAPQPINAATEPPSQDDEEASDKKNWL
jgi:Tat protein translocase TatB subunit